MESLFLLIPLSLLLVGLAIWVFLRMSDTGQFDDMEGPAHSILMDDDRPRGAQEPPPVPAQRTADAPPPPPPPPQAQAQAEAAETARSPAQTQASASVPRNE